MLCWFFSAQQIKDSIFVDEPQMLRSLNRYIITGPYKSFTGSTPNLFVGFKKCLNFTPFVSIYDVIQVISSGDVCYIHLY